MFYWFLGLVVCFVLFDVICVLLVGLFLLVFDFGFGLIILFL